AGDDRLFVPVENIEVLSRYGSEEAGAQLDRLGGVAWQSRKARVKQRIREIAGELIRVAAERQLRPGEALVPPEGLYAEFEARFPYPETEDQLRAIEETLSDLASGKPMDRLVCGDVGFGKTEVALRAAFITAFAGAQVAVIVPTTLLARQHFRSFSERYAGLPVRVAQLSRLVSPKEAKQTKAELAEGKIDIVIGTHALLAKGVRFHQLGLVVVDEEQHFGVKQKERLKQLKADVHVLTLTATPIPRTLQLALSGVREMSIIATPPVDRLAVRAFDVLLSTNIIESGLDIPTANTLIVHRADMFGLAQLYQLRGRIGRSKLRAYAYLTLPEKKKLAPTAQRRLDVMQTLDTLGAGFQLASHDLDIRGAGNLLGAELIDRFGPLPAEVDNLLQIIAIKRDCREAGIERVEAGPKGAVITLRGNRFANPAGLVELIQKNAGTLRLRPDQRLVYLRNWEDESERLAGVARLLRTLVGIARAGTPETGPMPPPTPELVKTRAAGRG